MLTKSVTSTPYKLAFLGMLDAHLGTHGIFNIKQEEEGSWQLQQHKGQNFLPRMLFSMQVK